MTDHDLQPCPDAAGAILGLLAARYPAFRFRRERLEPRGQRWIALRKKGLDPGLHTLITADLGELRAALAEDEARHAP